MKTVERLCDVVYATVTPASGWPVASVPPAGPRGTFRESGPVFLYPENCAGPGEKGWTPEPIRTSRRTPARRSRGGFLQTHNVAHGCYMQTIQRAVPVV